MKHSVPNGNGRLQCSYTGLCITLVCLLFASHNLSAQHLVLESSQPAHMSESVDLETIVSFTFNTPVDISYLHIDDIGDYILAGPSDKVTINELNFSNDDKTITLDVSHEADTDFMWTITGLMSADGYPMERMQVVSYTTKAETSDLVIEGALSFVNTPYMFFKAPGELSKTASSNDLSTINRQRETSRQSRILSPGQPSLQTGHQKSAFEELQPVSMSLDDPENGVPWEYAFVMLLEDLDWMDDPDSDGPGPHLAGLGVAEPQTGDYLIENVRDGDYYLLAVLAHPYADFDIVGLGMYQDDDGEPALVTVDGAGLSGLDITVFGFIEELAVPIDASEAFAVAADFMADYPDARPVNMWGEDAGFDDFYYFDRSDVLEPSGKSYFWEVVYLEDATEQVFIVFVVGEVAFLEETFYLADLPEDYQLPIPVSEIKTIDETFLPSADALAFALSENLDSLVTMLDPVHSWAFMDYELGSFYFEYPDLLDDTAPLFWSLMFYSDSWDMETNTNMHTDAVFLLDASDGTLLNKKITTHVHEDPGVSKHDFMEVWPVVQEEVDATDLEGFFIQSWGREDFRHPSELSGASERWMLAWFNPDEEVSYLFFTEGMEIVGRDTFYVADADPDEVPPLDLIGPVSGVNVGSMQALRVAMDNGLADNMAGLTDYYYDHLDYSLLGFYFMYPDLMDEDSNPFWQIELKAEKMDEHWNVIDSLKLIYLVDAVTGDFIAQVGDEPVDPVDPVDPVEAVDATTAFVVAADSMGQVNPDARPVVIEGRDSVVDGIHFSEVEGALPAPSGKSKYWDIIFLVDATETLYFVEMDGESIYDISSISIGDLPPEEIPPIPVSEIPSIPSEFITSQNALASAVENSLEDLIGDVMPYSWTRLEYMLFGDLLFEYADMFPDPGDRPIWHIVFQNELWDEESETAIITEGLFLIDAETGDFIDKFIRVHEETETEKQDLLDLIPLVQAEMDDIDENAVFIQSFGREDFHLPVQPTGTSEGWMLVWFNFDLETFHVFEVVGTNIVEYETGHLDDVPEDERPPVDQVTPAVDVTIRSAEALNVAMVNGMSDALAGLTSDHFISVKYSLAGFYFMFPEFMDEDSNPFWMIELIATQYDENFNRIDSLEVTYLVDAVTGAFIDQEIDDTYTVPLADLPVEYSLQQNYPNPFNPATVIRYELPADSEVRLEVFDMLGRRVATLVNGQIRAGRHEVTFDGTRLASGTYIYRLQAGNHVQTRKMMFVK